MKLGLVESRKRQRIRSSEALAVEPVESEGFSPEIDISTKRRDLFFRELNEYAEKKAWLEYIILFNHLKTLFPHLVKKKEQVPMNELKQNWDDARIRQIRVAVLDKGRDPYNQVDVLAELKAFGISFSEEPFLKAKKFWRDQFPASFNSAVDEAVALVRLGFSISEDALKQAGVSIENIRAQIEGEEKKQNPDLEWIIKLIAHTKILFPQNPLTVSKRQLALAKGALRGEPNHQRIRRNAEAFLFLFIATAETAYVDENGNYTVIKEREKIKKSPELPIRQVF